MLRTLCSSNTGMQARQILERKPPTCGSLPSVDSSACISHRRERIGEDRKASRTFVRHVGIPILPDESCLNKRKPASEQVVCDLPAVGDGARPLPILAPVDEAGRASG